MNWLGYIFLGAVIILLFVRQQQIMNERYQEVLNQMNKLRVDHLKAAAKIALGYTRSLRAAKVWKQAAKKWWKVSHG
jgi:hypothetical protein